MNAEVRYAGLSYGVTSTEPMHSKNNPQFKSCSVPCGNTWHIKMDPVFTLSFTGDGDERGMWGLYAELGRASPLQ